MAVGLVLGRLVAASDLVLLAWAGKWHLVHSHSRYHHSALLLSQESILDSISSQGPRAAPTNRSELASGMKPICHLASGHRGTIKGFSDGNGIIRFAF